jgi:hypothetical protein
MGPEEFERRLEALVREPPAPKEGRAALQAFVDEMIAELTERIELLALREERDLERKVVKATADVSLGGEKRTRYQAMARREMSAALRELRLLQADRRKHGDGDDKESDRPQGEEAAQTAPDASAAPGAEARAQNEATVSQVAGTPGDCDVTDGTPREPDGAITPEELARIRAMIDESRRKAANNRLRE